MLIPYRFYNMISLVRLIKSFLKFLWVSGGGSTNSFLFCYKINYLTIYYLCFGKWMETATCNQINNPCLITVLINYTDVHNVIASRPKSITLRNFIDYY